jgi:hypothetical protein
LNPQQAVEALEREEGGAGFTPPEGRAEGGTKKVLARVLQGQKEVVPEAVLPRLS